MHRRISAEREAIRLPEHPPVRAADLHRRATLLGRHLLFDALARSPRVWTIGCEGHQAIEASAGTRARRPRKGLESPHPGRRDPGNGGALSCGLPRPAARPGGNPAPDGAVGLRTLATTTKNALRVPFLDAALPNSLFIYVYRDPRESLGRMIDAWESGRFITYPRLPDWPGPPWSMVLTPEWRSLRGRPLAEIVADQWAKATETLLADLDRLPARRIHALDYAALIDDPKRELERICAVAQIELDSELELPLPKANSADTRTPEQARRESRAGIAGLAARARRSVSERTLGRPRPERCRMEQALHRFEASTRPASPSSSAISASRS